MLKHRMSIIYCAISIPAEDKTYFDKLIAVGCIPIETTPDEGMIHRTYQYISGQLAFSSELEQTNIYNVVNIARMLVPALTAYAAGPVVMGLQLGLQFALYSTPALRNKASAAYYYLKPFIHNNMHWMVDDLFDTAQHFHQLRSRQVLIL